MSDRRAAAVGSGSAGLGTGAGMRGEGASDGQTLRQLQTEIAARLGRGDPLDGVERELIAPSRLSEERKSALWLHGWSLPKLARRGALPYLESLA